MSVVNRGRPERSAHSGSQDDPQASRSPNGRAIAFLVTRERIEQRVRSTTPRWRVTEIDGPDAANSRTETSRSTQQAEINAVCDFIKI